MRVDAALEREAALEESGRFTNRNGRLGCRWNRRLADRFGVVSAECGRVEGRNDVSPNSERVGRRRVGEELEIAVGTLYVIDGE